MKKYLLITISIITLQTSYSQTAADYYLPLCVGNYLQFYTPDNGMIINGGWEGRNTFNSIIREDIINGETYYLQKGYEVMDFGGSTNVFHYFWLRKDSNGDILIGAYDMTQSGTLDSATIVPSGSAFFSSSFLTLGYKRTMVTGVGSSIVDSVVSISETVGIHSNCLRIRTTRKNNNVIDMVEDTYYAPHLGKIKIERTAPSWQMHTDNIVDSVVVDCYLTGVADKVVEEDQFKVYPNPASDFITLNWDGANVINTFIYIYNVVGELVHSELLQQEQQAYIGNLSNGVYMVEVNRNGRKARQKLIIQR